MLNQNEATACWNCRTYLNQLWPYGRVESRNLDKRAAGKYMAKYMAKSFHLRTLYQEHGLTDQQRTYHFFHNLYQYQPRPVKLVGKSKIDQLTNQKLNSQQTVFRHYDYETQQTSYYYLSNKKLVGRCQKPILIKKNYRLGTRSLKTFSLLKLAKKPARKEIFSFRPPKPKSNFSSDFQEFLITRLLALCQTAEFSQVPLEQERVPKEAKQCSGTPYTHFQTKPVLRFTFPPENVATVRKFIENLDEQANEYDMEESQDFYFYPSEEAREIWTPIQARNQYLDNWWMNYCRDNFYSSRLNI